MTPRFPRLMLSSMMFIGIALAACDAPAEPGDSSLPESSETAPQGVDAPMPAEPEAAMDEAMPEAAPHSDVPPPSRAVFSDGECDFEAWVGKPLDEAAIKATERPSRVMTPGSAMTMDHNPDRINVEHENGTVTRVWCG